MKIGDLVKWKKDGSYVEWVGIIVREIPSPAQLKAVYWINTLALPASTTIHQARELKLVNENR
jgi:hypothetical protein